MKRRAYASLADKLLERSTRNSDTGCIDWDGCKSHNHYGKVCWGGALLLTHRAAWEVANGAIPEGMWVLHKCDRPSCINPDHLFLGNNAENVRDAVRKGRHYWIARTHCKRGHEFSSENTGRTARGARVCKRCAFERRAAKATADNKRRRERRAANIERVIERERAYYRRNKKRIDKNARDRRAMRADYVNRRQSEWRRANREKVLEYGRKWREANRDQINGRRREARAKRRAESDSKADK